MIGQALTRYLLEKGYEVMILTRGSNKFKQNGVSFANWDVNAGTMDEKAIPGTDHIVHLAGANVAEGRWTKKRKKEILDSRVRSGELLLKMMDKIPNQIQSFVSASATGYYGPDGSLPNLRPFQENDPPENDFLGSVVQQWEAAVKPVEARTRLVILRTGIVLSREGGAFPEFKKTLPMGFASILGSGKQVISWIHIDDLVRIYTEALENENLRGIYNAVAPTPVSNKDLTLEIARQRKKFYLPIHVPEFVLKTMLGEMSIEVLKSTTVSVEKIEKEGFVFNYPTIDSAVKDLLTDPKNQFCPPG